MVAHRPTFREPGRHRGGVGLLLWRWDRFIFFVSILTCCFVLFLGRGGVVLYYYVIPVLAFMAVAIGLVTGFVMNLIARWRPVRQVVAPAVLVATLLMTNTSFDRNSASLPLMPPPTSVRRLSGSSAICPTHPF